MVSYSPLLLFTAAADCDMNYILCCDLFAFVYCNCYCCCCRCATPPAHSCVTKAVHATPTVLNLPPFLLLSHTWLPDCLSTHQSTNSGFGHVSQENVFKVCDQPHPHKLRAAIQKAREGNTQEALDVVMALWQVGAVQLTYMPLLPIFVALFAVFVQFFLLFFLLCLC